ncbi:MAG: hypothetical protein U0996_21895 [Planctomycetaceae bacterium]
MPFLRLWHGRRSLEADLEGWDVDGPTFGPFPHFQMTYFSEIRFGEGLCLEVVEGLVFYDGVYYGDWSFTAEPESSDPFIHEFDPAKAVLPLQCVEPSETPPKGGDF